MKPYCLIFGLILYIPLLFGQSHQGANETKDRPLRLEVKVNSDKETYRIIPCGQHGMILFYQSIELTADNAVKWYFAFYDKNLQQVWIRNVPIESGLGYREAILEQDTLMFFFEADKKKKKESNDFQILRIALNNGNLILNNGVLTHPASIAGFVVLHQRAYIGLNQDDGFAKILVLDLPTGKKMEFHILKNNKATIAGMTMIASNHRLFLQVLKKIGKQTNQLQLVSINLEGTNPVLFEPEYNSMVYHMDQCKMIETANQTLLNIGSYLQEAKLRKIKEHEATGLFTSLANPETMTSAIKFFNFLDLDHIADLLNERDLLSLKKKSLKKPQNEQQFSLDLSLVLHDIIKWKDQYLLAAESYYPQFRTETYTDYDFYGRPYTNSYNVFDGYRFTGFILTAFDASGNLLWDNTMDFRNVVRYMLQPKVVVHPMEDEIILAYVNEGKIVSKIIAQGNIVEDLSYGDMMHSSPNDRLLKETKSQMVYWYDDYFLCYGYQEIRDISKTTTDKRLVFYCNKIKFER
jgi:hypothetical protein